MSNPYAISEYLILNWMAGRPLRGFIARQESRDEWIKGMRARPVTPTDIVTHDWPFVTDDMLVLPPPHAGTPYMTDDGLMPIWFSELVPVGLNLILVGETEPTIEGTIVAAWERQRRAMSARHN